MCLFRGQETEPGPVLNLSLFDPIAVLRKRRPVSLYNKAPPSITDRSAL